MKRTKTVSVLAVVLAAALLLSACGTADESTPATEKTDMSSEDRKSVV